MIPRLLAKKREAAAATAQAKFPSHTIAGCEYSKDQAQDPTNIAFFAEIQKKWT
jgi:hypothetical protein